MKRFYNLLTVLLFCLFFGGIGVASLLIPDQSFSEMENRNLRPVPELTISRLKSGRYMTEAESYASDQIAFRNLWVAIKATGERLSGKQENNGIYLAAEDTLIRRVAEPDTTLLDKNIQHLRSFAQQSGVPVYFGLKFKKHKTAAERKLAKKLNVNFFQELTKLRLLANSVSLVYPEWKAESSKIAALRDVLSSLKSREDNKVLIFSQFTSFLSQIGLMLKDAGIEYLYLDGQTAMDERQRLVDEFQSGDCQFFLISLKAGGLGLNLTAANYVILMDPWWNPSIEDQATDRAHRIGQERNVTVIRLISANTIEEKILKLHEDKQSLSDRILEGTSGSASLTMDEILDMVSPYR